MRVTSPMRVPGRGGIRVRMVRVLACVSVVCVVGTWWVSVGTHSTYPHSGVRSWCICVHCTYVHWVHMYPPLFKYL